MTHTNEPPGFPGRFKVGAGQGVTVHLGQSKPAEHHYLVNTGPFAGRDQRDVLREAFAWWETYLNGIDEAAGVPQPIIPPDLAHKAAQGR